MISRFNIIPIYSFFCGMIKKNSIISIGNVAAVFTLNIYFEEFWLPIIFLIVTLFFFSTCILLFYKYKNKKIENDNSNGAENLIKSREIFKTAFLSLLIFIVTYI